MTLTWSLKPAPPESNANCTVLEGAGWQDHAHTEILKIIASVFVNNQLADMEYIWSRGETTVHQNTMERRTVFQQKPSLIPLKKYVIAPSKANHHHEV